MVGVAMFASERRGEGSIGALIAPTANIAIATMIFLKESISSVCRWNAELNADGTGMNDSPWWCNNGTEGESC
jgi:hypothetical protein